MNIFIEIDFCVYINVCLKESLSIWKEISGAQGTILSYTGIKDMSENV